MKKAVAFTTTTPSFLAIWVFVLSVVLLCLLQLASASRLLSEDVHGNGVLPYLAGPAVARNLGGVGGSPYRGDGKHNP
ncbi:hypothetical protein CDL15_Pgr028798 [Punica granatum]|uniref:Uncharacterized protein n=1 Tax=Punica granatum TaxID=22663 RepID=A0A218VYC2_PUNGR|nr:hypothetical protein CDL15_Pgr028798 [Punica granatum]